MKNFPEWQHKLVKSATLADGTRIRVTAGLHYIQGNKRPYFTVTCDGWSPGRVTCDFGGCCHNEVLQAFPQLRPVVDLHLSDDFGVPMHAVANAEYWAKEKNLWNLLNHVRINSISPRVLGRALEAGGAPYGEPLEHQMLAIADMAAFVEVLKPTWKRQAKNAIRILTELNKVLG
jgi:hypothetical protein